MASPRAFRPFDIPVNQSSNFNIDFSKPLGGGSGQPVAYSGFVDKEAKTGTGVPFRSPPPQVQGEKTDGGGDQGGGGGFSGGGGGGSFAANLAVLRADARQKAATANSLFKSILGDIDRVVRDQSQRISGGFDEQRGIATEQFQEDLPGLRASFNARGLADSSFREDAEAQAAKAFQRQLGEISGKEQEALADVSRFRSQQRGDIAQDRGSIDDLVGRLDKVTDVDQLENIQNQINQKIRAIRAQRGTLDTQSGFLGRLRKVAPRLNKQQAQGLRQSISNIVNAEAPQSVKEQVGQALIQNSALAAGDKDKLFQEFQQALASQEA